MKCMEIENLALDYLDGTLIAPVHAAMEAHLTTCAACAGRMREFSAGFGELLAKLDDWPSMPASRTFDSRVLDQIHAAESSWWSRHFTPVIASLARPAFAGMLSMVLIAAFAVVRFFPGANLSSTLPPDADPTIAAIDGGDEVALVQDLNDLDDLEMLRNFEVLQVMKGSTP